MDSPQINEPVIEVVVAYTRDGIEYVTPSVDFAWHRSTEGHPEIIYKVEYEQS